MAVNPVGASEIINSVLRSWGIPQLRHEAMNLIQQGLSSDAIIVQLQESPAYKQRFAANAQRKAKGLPELSPADYISAEASYKDLLRQYGLPAGFYDQHSDLSNFIANDVSPSELDQRLQLAQQVWLNSADPGTRKAYKDYYNLTDGEVIAGILNPKQALPKLQHKVAAAQIGGAAENAGLGVGRYQAENLAARGISQAQATQGFQQIAQTEPTDQSIAHRFGTDFTQQQEINDVLLGDAAAAAKRKQLYASEKGLFDGSASASNNSLSSTGS